MTVRFTALADPERYLLTSERRRQFKMIEQVRAAMDQASAERQAIRAAMPWWKRPFVRVTKPEVVWTNAGVWIER